MSGSPKASRIEKYFRIDYASGISMTVSRPPDESDPSVFIGEKFENWSIPYEQRLGVLLPDLNKLMAAYLADPDVPIMPYAPSVSLPGFVISALEEESQKVKSREKALEELWALPAPAARIEFPVEIEEEDNILLFSMALSRPIEQAQLGKIQKEIGALFAVQASINEEDLS